MMNPAIFVSLVWLLCMVAAVAHGAQKVSKPVDALDLVLAFAATFALAVLLSPQPGWVGFLAAVFAGWRLIHTGAARVDRVLSGLSAGLAGALFAGYGLNVWIAAGSAALVLVLALALVRGAKSATSGAREAALATVALGAVVAGLAPEVANGWRSALVLNKVPAVAHAAAIPGWTLAFVGLALLVGAVRGLVVRK